MAQEATIRGLILAAAEGASDGVSVLQDADIPVELEEFEIKVTYAAETSLTTETQGNLGAGFAFKLVPLRAKIGHTRSTRKDVTYGLTVRFLFTGKETEEEGS